MKPVKFMNLRKFYKISENFCLSEASFHILLEARRAKNEWRPKGLSVRLISPEVEDEDST